jgi:hypothetical protein
MIALERDNLDLMRVGQGRGTPIAEATEIQQRAADRGLLSDQAEAASMTLTARDWITAIEGRAGSAKTTTVGAIAEFARVRGYSVQGFAPTTRAVKSLSEAGVNARTVASLVENPSPPAGEKQFWIVDESSLLSTRQMNRLLHTARTERRSRRLSRRPATASCNRSGASHLSDAAGGHARRQTRSRPAPVRSESSAGCHPCRGRQDR